MRSVSLRRMICREARSFLFSHYRDSLLLSSCLLLLCCGISGVYRVLCESVLCVFPFEAQAVLSEICLFLLVFLAAPIFGGIFFAFPRRSFLDTEQNKEKTETGDFLLFCRCDAARRSSRLAFSLLYGLTAAIRMLSCSLFFEKLLSPQNDYDTMTDAVFSVLIGAGVLLLYAAVAFFGVCVLCVLLSGKLISQSFAACFFRTVKNIFPISDRLYCGIFSFAIWSVVCFRTCGAALLFFCLPYWLYYLHFFGVYADCRRFAVPSGSRAFPTTVRYDMNN